VGGRGSFFPVTDYAAILRTTDGGVTWTAQSSGTINFLFGVSFTDANTGTAVGGFGTILHTTTGGEPPPPRQKGRAARPKTG
jgi:photosystem II stability/assembly factor-like uncharacterized protein